MNKSKWLKKYRYHDSGRWLKHNPPHYINKARDADPAHYEEASRAIRAYPRLKALAAQNGQAIAYSSGRRRGASAEWSVVAALSERDQSAVDAVERSMRDIHHTPDPGLWRRVIRCRVLQQREVNDIARENSTSHKEVQRIVHWFIRNVSWHLGYRKEVG